MTSGSPFVTAQQTVLCQHILILHSGSPVSDLWKNAWWGKF